MLRIKRWWHRRNELRRIRKERRALLAYQRGYNVAYTEFKVAINSSEAVTRAILDYWRSHAEGCSDDFDKGVRQACDDFEEYLEHHLWT